LPKLINDPAHQLLKEKMMEPKIYTARELAALIESATQDERERCAKVCEDRAGTVSMFVSSREARDHNATVRGCAAAIRQGEPSVEPSVDTGRK
jgi:uncharacterized protein (DUF2384 family)